MVQSGNRPDEDWNIFFGISLLTLLSDSSANKAEPAYSYIVCNRFSAMIELNIVTLVFISLLFYLSSSLIDNIFCSLGVYDRRAPLYLSLVLSDVWQQAYFDFESARKCIGVSYGRVGFHAFRNQGSICLD